MAPDWQIDWARVTSSTRLCPPVHKPKPRTSAECGAEVPDQPMPVLEHQLSHLKRRPYARDRPKRDRLKDQDERPIDQDR